MIGFDNFTFFVGKRNAVDSILAFGTILAFADSNGFIFAALFDNVLVIGRIVQYEAVRRLNSVAETSILQKFFD